MEPLDWLALALLVTVLYSLYRAHHNQSMKNFNIFDLVMENGRISKIGCVFLATWLVYTWAVVKTVSKGSLDGLMSYGTIFAMPIIAKMWSSPPAKPPTE